MAKRRTTKAPAPKTAEVQPARGGRPRAPRPDTLEGHLGEQVERRRKAAGWTAQQLAKAADVGNGTVLSVERGEGSASLRVVVAIAHALGVSAAELLAEVDEWTAGPAKR